MNANQTTKLSKFLSLILRHQPEAAGVVLDEAGWVRVDDLLKGCAQTGKSMTLEELKHIVETNEKKRFEFSEDGRLIRASQGHSVEVDLGYTPQMPPERLYHGTATRFLQSIREHGLRRRQRQHVHLSATPGTATEVGARHGKVVVLEIFADRMQQAGFAFYLSTNSVWLVDQVPVDLIVFP